MLKNILKARIDEKIQQYEQFRDNFFEMIRDRKQQYEDLKAKDAESAKKIDEQMERIKTITVRQTCIFMHQSIVEFCRFYFLFCLFVLHSRTISMC